jgi:hypothetical protein
MGKRAMTEPATIGIWMIEVLGDGIDQRHADTSPLPTTAKQLSLRCMDHVGSEPIVTSSTQLEGEAARVCQMQLGDVRGV